MQGEGLQINRGTAWHDRTWQGTAGQDGTGLGVALRGDARQGFYKSITAGRGGAWRGEAVLVGARRGSAGHGTAMQGEGFTY